MKPSLYFSLISLITPLLLLPTANAQALPTKSPTNTSTQIAATPQNIQKIAQSITVKVFVKDSRGSGIIIAKQGQTYTVLTNAHVVNRGQPFRIQTPDGKSYNATLITQGNSLKDNDLAVLQFSSPDNYQVAKFADSSNLSENQTVYSAGFPIDETSLKLTAGKISVITPKALVGGYQIGYTNDTFQGMSGGALLNQQGDVIGVIGMGAEAILNDAYVYTDGTRPRSSTIQQLRGASFAVPIANLGQVAPNLAASIPNAGGNANRTVYTGIVAKIDKIAEQITVKIDSINNGNGSGVIVAKNGQNYYVLTASHVVENQDKYTIVTPDGRKYALSPSNIQIFKGVDLAVVQFSSSSSYQVATLAKYDFQDYSKQVFVSGFPQLNRNQTNQQSLLLTFGYVWRKDNADFFAKEKASLSQGQDLVYSNISYGGMSGGAVLDSFGRLVGINTGAENESANNQRGEVVEFSVGYSLGVPISTFLSLASQAKVTTNLLQVQTNQPSALTQTEFASIVNQLVSLQVPSKDADAFAWLNYGNQLWRIRDFKEALAAFDKAIQIIQHQPNFSKQYYAQAYYGKGLTLYWMEKYSEAVDALKQATQIDPKFHQAWRLRGAALKSLKKYPEALASYQQAIKLSPQEFVLYVELGNTFSNLERYQDAIVAYSDAIKIKQHPWAYNNRGLTYKSLQEYQKALADYNRAIKLQPDYADGYYNRGVTYFYLQEYQKALAEYNRAIALQLDNAKAYNNRGNTYDNLQEYQKALADYNRAIELQPDLAEVYYNRGNTYDNLQEYQKALADYTRAIELQPDLAIAYSNRGNTYKSLQEYQKALADYTRAIALKPDDAKAYYNRGVTYGNLQEYQKALADFTQAIALEPDYASAYYNRGLTYDNLQEYQKAIADYTRAIELQPDLADAYNSRGVTYYNLQEYQKALADYTSAIALQPDLADAYNNRGNTYDDLQEYQKAIADYNRAIALQPDDTEAYYNRGITYYNLQEYQKALADYNRAIALKPNDADAYSNRGLTYFNLQEYQKAIADYNRAIALQPDDAKAYGNRGLTYSKLQEYQKAFADLQKAAQLFYEQGDMQMYQEVQEAIKELQSKL
ncbi:Tetratricopeptide TPR_1 repeat-containing protein [Crinalium epipsammum PCC 9333]|uniref:Tetratricopeptide TPR_1 repeat-containing protein n=1 Tax=Crinalium epipsammum PCC 9333 TaxID=1173022 RepID=K9W380_9CYAN|nr:serine protease [Crinalium epipsammum]AFZ14818.1 Tetratricopeptide TPR_1 repeat-containing protein [Crinalium epipsammum PCC 9333]